ncbi:hypothetical protein FISHEDRAFT_77206 [Fistulina hepatica ATCC 64428]|uniref:Uncharacterized protein n=1 Tax=Fistulina hepatica ATCC 64428 TaxID=1128425 RepID=A0A0D7A1X2_9AGAR|nr:hypothetical protein FISHEDRAFT_77206 [Fistulina hepatica ATCC 64428]
MSFPRPSRAISPTGQFRYEPPPISSGASLVHGTRIFSKSRDSTFFPSQHPSDFLSAGRRIPRGNGDADDRRPGYRFAHLPFSETSTSLVSQSSRPQTADSTVSVPSNPFKRLSKLGFNLRRYRNTSTASQHMVIIPDVIEVVQPDPELQERERLREAAAQSIGIVDPVSRSKDVYASPVRDPPPDDRPETPTVSSSSALECAVPAFPTTPLTLSTCAAVMPISTTIPRYYPSLRLLSLGAKGWKARHVVVSVDVKHPVAPAPQSPTSRSFASSSYTHFPSSISASSSRTGASRVSQSHIPPRAFVHVFRTKMNEETELERLEITEESAAYIAEGDIGGKKGVVKIEGVIVRAPDLSAAFGAVNAPERVTWFFHVSDPDMKQKLITAVKSIVHQQRAVRAGTLTKNGSDSPMLSTRVQRTPTQPSYPMPSPKTPKPDMSPARSSHPYASLSVSSSYQMASQHQSQPQPQSQPSLTVQRPPRPMSMASSTRSTTAVSALRGFFGRPRSPSIDSAVVSREDAGDDESFGHTDVNLMSLVNPTGSTSPNGVALARSMSASHVEPMHIGLDRRITQHWVEPSRKSVESDIARPKAMSMIGPSNGYALQLHPPPRKRWSAMPPLHRPSTSSDRGHQTLQVSIGQPQTSVYGTFGGAATQGYLFSTPEMHPRQPSIASESVSTFASLPSAGSENLHVSSSLDSGRRNSKRWSRQGSLPQRPSPPNGPPPATPPSSVHRLHPYAGGVEQSRPPSRTSVHSFGSQRSNLPSFSKRTSTSSAFSSVSVSSQSNGSPLGGLFSGSNISHRNSIIPPPRPAPTFALPSPPEPFVEEPPRASTSSEGPSSSGTKSSFRDTVASRAMRLSILAAPKPPPVSRLPPRPDENKLQPNHRRRTSQDSYQHNDAHVSFLPSMHDGSPYVPPPMGPLPPTPIMSSSIASPSFIGQRIRNMSSTPPSTPSSSPSNYDHDYHVLTRNRPSTMTIMPRPMNGILQSASPISTPTSEKPSDVQNGSSFLQMHTPAMSAFAIPPSTPPPPPPPADIFPEVISLSPAPRRGSKQLSFAERPGGDDKPIRESSPEHSNNGNGDSRGSGETTNSYKKMFSLSRHGSVISLGIVSV